MKDKKYDKAKDTISIKQFLFQYLNINSSCIRLRHCDLKKFESPLVVMVGNEYADKNPDLVKEGFLILVLDCKKDKATYINPTYLKNIVIAKGIIAKMEEIERTKVYTFEDYKELYDLSKKLEEELSKVSRSEYYESDLEELEIMGKSEVIEKLEEHENKWNSVFSKKRIRVIEND